MIHVTVVRLTMALMVVEVFMILLTVIIFFVIPDYTSVAADLAHVDLSPGHSR